VEQATAERLRPHREGVQVEALEELSGLLGSREVGAPPLLRRAPDERHTGQPLGDRKAGLLRALEPLADGARLASDL
jgi:hypothetical protein